MVCENSHPFLFNKGIMKNLKKALAFVWPTIVCLPCLFVFTEGNDGGLTVFNVIGIVWIALLTFGMFRELVPRWIKLYIGKVCR